VGGHTPAIATTNNHLRSLAEYDVPNITRAATPNPDIYDLPVPGSSGDGGGGDGNVFHCGGRVEGDESGGFYEVTAPGYGDGYGHEDAPSNAYTGNNEYDVGAPLKNVNNGNNTYDMGAPLNRTLIAAAAAARGGAAGAVAQDRRKTKRLQSGSTASAVGAGGQCQRPSPKGGTCKNAADGRSQFCKGHTCSLDWCFEGKSSSAATCPDHACSAHAASVDVEDAGAVYHVPCGGNFYELPPANGQEGAVVYDVAPDAADDGTAPPPVPPGLGLGRKKSVYRGFEDASISSSALGAGDVSTSQGGGGVGAGTAADKWAMQQQSIVTYGDVGADETTVQQLAPSTSMASDDDAEDEYEGWNDDDSVDI
jgi:hypothetical protein